MKKSELVLCLLIAAVLGAALALGGAYFLFRPAKKVVQKTEKTEPALIEPATPTEKALFSERAPFRPADEETAGTTAEHLQQNFNRAIESAMPAVVLISAQRRVGVIRRPYFNLFDRRNQEIDYYHVPGGQGSGFFIRSDGHILTNFHVVKNQDSFWVTTHDGKEFPAEVVGVDPPTDLAVLRVKADHEFSTIKFADPATVEIGNWAIAIGAPFNLSRTVTIGIVSNKKRSGVGVNLHESYIQTDASINPGNSGGPLLNIHGEVMGVNDFIMSPSGGNIGLSFAISSEIAAKVADLLIREGAVERPWLGIQMEALNREQRSTLGIPNGVLVARIVQNSPAADLLRNGDVILKVNGEALESPHELQGQVFSAEPGRAFSLEILRRNRPETVTVTLQAAPRNWFRFQQQTRNATLARWI